MDDERARDVRNQYLDFVNCCETLDEQLAVVRVIHDDMEHMEKAILAERRKELGWN